MPLKNVGSSTSNASSDSDLYGMLQEYIQENKTLKSENSQLEKFREKIRQQHEILTRENEKLARKLDQVLRTQGQPSIIANTNANPEFVVVDDSSASFSQPQRLLVQPKTQSPQQVHIISNNSNKILPRIEKKNSSYPPVEVVSVRSTSPIRSNRSTPKKIYVSQANSDPGDFSSSSNGMVE